MTEQEIRDFLARIEEVRARWEKEVETYFPDEYINTEPSKEGLQFYDAGSYGDSGDSGTIPWLAFTDFDAAVAEFRTEKARQDAAYAAAREKEQQRLYERLKAKYGDA
jgi:hypothetical protein